MGNCNTGRCKPKAKPAVCTVPQASLTINKWSCDYPAGKKCNLVEYDGFIYGLNEDRLECSVLPPPADDGYTRAMDTATAIEWVAKCKGCCDPDKYIDSITMVGDTITAHRSDGTTFPQVVLDGKKLGGCVDSIRYLQEKAIL